MAGMEGYKRPGRYEAAFHAGSQGGAGTPPGGEERGIPPHEELVTAIQGVLARESEQAAKEGHSFNPFLYLHLSLNSAVNESYKPGESPSAKYLFFEGLRDAWDALSYDRYPEGGNKQMIERSLHHYLDGTHIARRGNRPFFVLEDKGQVALLDVMAEAVDIPHQRGQRVIPLPASIRYDSRGNR